MDIFKKNTLCQAKVWHFIFVAFDVTIRREIKKDKYQVIILDSTMVVGFIIM